MDIVFAARVGLNGWNSYLSLYLAALMQITVTKLPCD
jgi:hypothetical protein